MIVSSEASIGSEEVVLKASVALSEKREKDRGGGRERKEGRKERRAHHLGRKLSLELGRAQDHPRELKLSRRSKKASLLS